MTKVSKKKKMLQKKTCNTNLPKHGPADQEVGVATKPEEKTGNTGLGKSAKDGPSSNLTRQLFLSITLAV